MLNRKGKGQPVNRPGVKVFRKWWFKRQNHSQDTVLWSRVSWKEMVRIRKQVQRMWSVSGIWLWKGKKAPGIYL